MITGLLIILALTFILPIVFKPVEHNLEIFLFVMGISAAAISGTLNFKTAEHILKNPFLYMITAAVLLVSILFKYFKHTVKTFIDIALQRIPLHIFVMLLIIILGLLSSIITAIIAALLLVEAVSALPINKKGKLAINIIACFSIGIGAALTPLGEPISTIVVSKLNANFTYILNLIGINVIVQIIALGVLAMVSIRNFPNYFLEGQNESITEISNDSEESFREIYIRTLKIFIFIIALDLLGSGFKPIIDNYIINLDTKLLYWGNMVSAVLDNATIAAAEISSKMNPSQIKAILLGLLLSGGMLIPGNIPNIITANKLKISSRDWIKLGVPLGLIMLFFNFIVLFLI